MVDGSQGNVLAHRESLMAFGHMVINDFNEPETLCHAPGSCYAAEREDSNFVGSDGLTIAIYCVNDILCRAEIFLHNKAWFAISP